MVGLPRHEQHGVVDQRITQIVAALSYYDLFQVNLMLIPSILVEYEVRIEEVSAVIIELESEIQSA